jgi:hypothetical protein
MELGQVSLGDANPFLAACRTPGERCHEWMIATPPQRSFDPFLKQRTRLKGPDAASDAAKISEMFKSELERATATFRNAAEELYERLRRAGYPLHYHNGFLQFSNDALIQANVEAPFWALIAASKWANVDADMKEALDRRDAGGRDPALYAARALESTIKIISGEKGWTHGKEKGAHNFIDNLRSKGNGRFIEVWEAEALKGFFTSVRNPLGHGPGGEPIRRQSISGIDAFRFTFIWQSAPPLRRPPIRRA